MDWRTNSESLRRDFERDGYVLLQGFLSDKQVAEVRRNVARFIEQVVPTLPAQHVFYEDKSDSNTLKQLQQMARHDPYFACWANESDFRRVAELLLDGRVRPENMQYFNKPPGVGQPTPPHQDGYYFMLDPCEAVTMWLALERVDEENGCVRYIPGSHRKRMRAHGRSRTLGFSQSITNYGPEDEAAELAFPAEPGDLLVHHALTIHRAGANQSRTRSRQALGLIYYSERARQDQQAHEAYQRRLAAEMTLAGKI